MSFILQFDELSHKSSHSSLSVSQHGAMSTPKDGSLENLGGGEFLRKSYATPPPRTLKAPPPVARTEEPKTTSGKETNHIDDWESKLFGRQGPVFNDRGNLTPAAEPMLES